MFILERLIGVGLYTFLLVFICFFMVGKSYKTIKRTLCLYTVILSFLAFFYVPYETADLYRIYETMVLLKKKTFEQIISSSNLSLGNVYYWIVAQTGVPQLLPAINAFICYNCIFYIICKMVQKYKISGRNAAIALFFYMATGTYIFVISGIRSMLGITLMSFCFFRECVEKKFNVFHIFIYVLAFLIHHYVAILIAIRLVVAIIDRKVSLKKKLIYIVIVVLSVAIIVHVFPNYIKQVIDKAEGYLTGNAYSYLWDYVVGVLVLLMNIYLLSAYGKIERKNIQRDFHSLYLFAVLLCLVGICFCFEFSIFHRTTVYVVPIICLPIWLVLLEKKQSKIEKNCNVYAIGCSKIGKVINVDVCLGMYAVILFLSCFHGTLCSLKFFVL